MFNFALPQNKTNPIMRKRTHESVIILRTPAPMKREVKRLAQAAGVSVGEFVRQAIAAAVAPPAGDLVMQEK